MKTDRPTWDEYGLLLAQAASARGDCRRSKVGAVILDRNQIVVSTGYNGTVERGSAGCLAGACPRGLMSYDEQPAGLAYKATGCTAIHAEANAIKWAKRAGQRKRLKGATVYVTREPCFGCICQLRKAGVSRAVYPSGVTFFIRGVHLD